MQPRQCCAAVVVCTEKSFVLACLHNPPANCCYRWDLDFLRKTLQHLADYARFTSWPFILVGDFNLNGVQWNGMFSCVDVFDDLDLQQYFDFNTTSANITDLILVTSDNFVIEVMNFDGNLAYNNIGTAFSDQCRVQSTLRTSTQAK